MKNKILIFAIFFISSCAMEPPETYHSFLVRNKSNTKLFVESRQLYERFNIDTLKQNQYCKKTRGRRGCTKDYHDTLIHSFFLNFKIIPAIGYLNFDPFNRLKWSDSLVLENNGFFCQSCKSGYVYHILTIRDTDIIMDSSVNILR